MWDNIYQPDQTGSEDGLIISDEEYKDSYCFLQQYTISGNL